MSEGIGFTYNIINKTSYTIGITGKGRADNQQGGNFSFSSLVKDGNYSFDINLIDGSPGGVEEITFTVSGSQGSGYAAILSRFSQNPAASYSVLNKITPLKIDSNVFGSEKFIYIYLDQTQVKDYGQSANLVLFGVESEFL